MKLNKFSKVLYTIASLCCLCVGSSNAIKQEILDARQNMSKIQKPATSIVVGHGQYGTIYQLKYDDKKLLKQMPIWSEPGETVSEIDLANMMCSGDVPSSLMKVYQVGRPNKETFWYTFEKIDGCSMQDYIKGIRKKTKDKIPWDVFCRHWTVGLFEGMKYVQDVLGTETIYNSFTKKDENCFFILGDRNSSNIMVRPDKTPVHIDYGFIHEFPISKKTEKPSKNILEIKNILLNLLENRMIKVPKDQKDRRDQLKKYLQSIEKMPMTIDLLDRVIRDIKKITGIN